MLLVTAGLAAVTTSAASAADPVPVPTPIWSTTTGATSPLNAGQPAANGVDAFGARSYVAATLADPGNSDDVSYSYGVYDATGALAFQDVGGSDALASLAAVDAGAWGAVVVGQVDGEIVTGADHGGTDGWVRRYAPDGTIDWTTQVGTSDSERLLDVAVLGDTVVAVGTVSGGGGSAIYTLDLATGAASGPITVDGPAQQAQLTSLAVLGDDVVVYGSTDRRIDGPADMSSYVWLARLDGDDLTDVVWETNGVGSGAMGSSSGSALAVVGGDVYTTGVDSSLTGYLSSYDGASGDSRFTRSVGPYSIAISLTGYRGGVVLGGTMISGVAGGPIGYDSLLQGWSTAGKVVWKGHLPQDDSEALVYITGLASAPGAGLVATGFTSDSTTGGSSVGTFLTALKTRVPRAAVKTGGAYKSTVTTTVKRGKSGTAGIRLTNAGELADKVRLKGCVTPASVTMTIKAGKKDVTKAVRNGSYTTPSLAVGTSTSLSVAIKAGPKANLRTIVCNLVSSSVANPGNTSTAVLKIAIKK